MGLNWNDKAWLEYLDWQNEDRKTLKKINSFLIDLQRNGRNSRLGQAEKLKGIDGYSKRIDSKNRLIYDFDDEENVIIIACKGHYNDK